MIGEVVLANLRVTPAKTGHSARMTLMADNHRSGLATTLSLISIAPGEVLSIDGRMLWIEVLGLTKDLPLGSPVSGTVVLGTGKIPFDLQVDKMDAKD